jgi:predicted alpha/beta hydrolase
LACADRSEPAVDERPLRIRAQDGYELGAVLYSVPTGAAPRRAVVLHGGAGIPARGYRRFARFLARSGIPVLTYDYRGVGLSRPSALRGFQAVIEDWAEYDCSAAIGWLREHFQRAELVGIAHSLGALLFGGAHNAAEQARLILIGAHTGYYGDYLPVYRLPMAALWHGLMPVLTRLIGYFPGRRLGLGDDIPAGVALQWASRRSSDLRPVGAGPSAERTRRLLDRCAALDCPALVIRMSDDAFATAAGLRRFLAYYPRLSLEYLLFTPADAGARKIGHFGFFSRRAGPALWPGVITRLRPPES